MKRLSVRRKLPATAFVLSALFWLAPSALASETPVKETVTSLVGWEVNATTKGTVCVFASEECQTANESEKASGFLFPEGVAAGPGPEHLVYVADMANRRIQTFTATGDFVRMFGWDVNKNGVTQQQKDVCGAGEECQAGQPVSGGPAGAIGQPTSVAVDPVSGDVYVLDYSENRIEKYTADGEFLYMVGGEVNKSKAAICTKEEEEECQAGVARSVGATTHGWFKPAEFRGNVITVDAGGVLYVGDEDAVQEFEADGKFLKYLSLAGTVQALAVNTTGELFLMTEPLAQHIYRLTANGEEVLVPGQWPATLMPREKIVEAFGADTLALDPAGRLAVTLFESYRDKENKPKARTYGTLLSSATAEQITSFRLEAIEGIPAQSHGLAFGTAEVSGQLHDYPMYAVNERQELVTYLPVPVAELVLKGANCHETGQVLTDARLTCELKGEVNPEGVTNTAVWFEWGRTLALGEKTPRQIVCSISCPTGFVPVAAPVEGVRPNDRLYFGLFGEDANTQPPETLESHDPKQESFTTPIVPPVVASQPEASFVHASSAVLFAELNPENAQTKYSFEYVAGGESLAALCPGGAEHEACKGVGTTGQREATCQQLISGEQECVYGLVGTTIEVAALQPNTLFRYRLYAESQSTDGKEHKNDLEKSNGEKKTETEEEEIEGTFTTAPAPAPQVVTGGVSDIGTTSATISGSVDPDGQSVAYAFELGIDNGDGTRYGVVSSGTVAPGTAFVPESLPLTGLQPGTAYRYRISLKNGDGGEIRGAAMGFVTLPKLELALNQVREIVGRWTFIEECKTGFVRAKDGRCIPVRPRKCKAGYRRDRHGKCVKMKHKHKKKHRAKGARRH